MFLFVSNTGVKLVSNETAIMHRALGGAPVSRVQWRSLGRSLLANVSACAAWLAALQQEKNSRSRRASSLQLSLHLKNKIFLGRSSAGAGSTIKKSRAAACHASWGGNA